MKSIKNQFYLTSILLLVLYTYIFAFDNSRKGFILGIGLGYGENFIKPQTEISGNIGNASLHINSSSCLDTKIGIGLSDVIEIALIDKIDLMKPFTAVIANNINAIEVSYYLKKGIPSLFFNASAGLSLWLYPFDPDWNTEYSGAGFCFSLGTGYEFVRHTLIMLEYQFSRPKHASSIDRVNRSVYGPDIVEKIEFRQINYTHDIRISIRYNLY